MPLFDFVCSAGHVTEALRSSGVAVIDCACGEVAQRRSVNRVAAQIGAEADWSSPVRDGGKIRKPVSERKVSLRQYREATEQLEYEHHRAEESAGQTLTQPELFQQARRKADKLLAGGITDSMDYRPEYGPKE